MATLTETGVRVEIVLRRDGAGFEAVARWASTDAAGERVRDGNRDIFDQLSPGRQAGIADLISDTEQRLRTLLEIAGP